MTGSRAATRVCLVTQRWAPEFSGAALRFRQYLPGLRDRGIDVDVLCSAAPSLESSDITSRWDELDFGDFLGADEVEGTSVYRVKLPSGPSLRRNTLFHHALTRLLETTQAAVTQYLTLDPLRTHRGGSLKRTGTPSVFTGTQLWTFSRNPAKRALQKLWIRVPLQRMDRVVVSSAVARDYYRSLGVTVPMSVIPNGVDLERFDVSDPETERRSARASLGISPDSAQVVVFVGSIIHRKGVDLLLEAFARVAAANARAELVLVGPRDEAPGGAAGAFDRRVDELVAQSGAVNRIQFTGQVQSVDRYLRAADVFVLPSRREGMGNVVLEAMAMGIPTVLTPYLGLPHEFGEPGTQFVLSDPDPEALASCIRSLLADPHRRETLGEAGRDWVTEHMGISTAIDEYARIYRDLAGYRSATIDERTSA